MRRDVVRFSSWAIVAVLLAAVLVTGCTRAKSAPPADSTPQGQTMTTTPEVQPTATSASSGEGPIAATTTAWAAATATAAASEPEPTAAMPTETTQATEVAEPTAIAATDTPQPSEEPEATESPTATQPSGTTEAQVHVVQPGENLFRIALQYGMTQETLANYNGITNPNLIYVGQRLQIPPTANATPQPSEPGSGQGTYHVVQPGENLYRIALQYNMLYTQLAAANDLSYPYTVYVGQRLLIPSN
jgi:LysM repeat protein